MNLLSNKKLFLSTMAMTVAAVAARHATSRNAPTAKLLRLRIAMARNLLFTA